MPTIKLKCSSIYYETHGKGAPLLMLHGLGSCGADWMRQIPYFSRHYQVITPDFAGHGKSTAETSHLTVHDIADDMVELLGALNIDSCHVVGLSFGSFVGLELALRKPNLASSLTLVGSSARVGDMNRPLAALYRFLVRVCSLDTIGAIISRLCFPQKKQTLERTVCKSHIACMNKNDFKYLFSDLMNFDVTKELSSIQCPTLIVAGKKDLLLPLHHSQKLHSLIPNSQLAVLEKCGHTIPMDSPSLFNPLLQTFLIKGVVAGH